MPEKPLFCLGEAWVELGADTVPELAETFRVSIGGWGAAFCRAYVRAGGHAALLSQLGADPFGRKAAAQLAADGIDCTHLCFTDAARTPVVFSGAGKLLPYRAPSAELLYAPEQLDAAALRGAFALCFSSGCLLDSPARLTHLKAIAAARDAGAFVCYAPRMAEAAPCWPDAAALRETALQFFPQADVLLLKDSDLVPLFGSHELRTALFSLFSGHVELIFYSSSDNVFLFTRNVLLQAATSDLTEAQFLRDLARLNTWPDKLAGLREATLKKLL
jgi:fructokinase